MSITCQRIFRGIDAAASLKHADENWSVQEQQVIFRGIDAAASLKRRTRQQRHYGRSAHLPRHRCRGLIEAPCSQHNGWRCAKIFRGIDAAASLKLQRR